MEAAAHQQIETEARLGVDAQLQISNAIVEQGQDEPSPVCVGDTVLITAPIEFFQALGKQQERRKSAYKDVMQKTTVCLEAEGVADVQVHITEQTYLMPKLHRCLFTILGCLYQHKRDSGYTRKSEREFGTRTEGEQVHFGDEIQLQHANSGNYVTFSSAPAASGFQITLGDRIGRETWVRVVGGAKGTKVGQPVYYHHRVALQAKCDFVEYYMHLAGHTVGNERVFTVSAYSEPFTWTLSKYQGRIAKENSVVLMRPIVFRHKNLRLRLSHTSSEDTDWQRIPQMFSFGLLSESQLDIQAPQEDAQTLQLSGSEEDGMCYWRLELPPQKIPSENASDPLSFSTQTIGGAAEAKKEYLLRNVLTNQYLGTELKLLAEHELSTRPYEHCLAPDNCALVRLMTAKVESKTLVDGIDVMLNIEEGHLEAEIAEISGKDIYNMIPSSIDASAKGRTDVILSDSSGEQSRYTFEVFNVKKFFCRFMEVTVEFLPLFKGFFNFLASWGVVSGAVSYSAAMLQLKELRQRRDIVLRAVKFLEKQLTGNITKEMLEERQNFIVSCRVHELLIDTARILMLRLGLSEEKRALRFAPGRGRELESILRSEMKDLVESITSLLTCVAFENVYVCKDLSSIYKEICSLFPLSQKFVANLLAEIYRLIDPPIHNYEAYFTEWLDRLETLTSENAEEQAVFLRLVRHLSEEDNNVNPFSQQQLVTQLLLSSTAFKMIRIALVDGRGAYVYFYTKGAMPEDQFLKDNAELAKLRFVIDRQSYFPMSELKDNLSKYANYVSEAMLLLNTMCKDDQPDALQCVQNELRMVPSALLQLCSDELISIAIRRSCVILAPTVTLNRQTLRISDTHGQTSMPPGCLQEDEIPPEGEATSPLAQWCYSCWTHHIALLQGSASCAELLDFIQAMLLLTIGLIDSKNVPPSFSQAISNSVEVLLIGLINPASEFMTMRNWDQLWQRLHDEENALELLYRRKRTTELTIELIQLNLSISVQNKVESLLSFYRRTKDAIPGFSFSGGETYTEIHRIVTEKDAIQESVEERAARLSLAKSLFQDVQYVEVEKPRMKEFISNCLVSTLKLTTEVRNMLFSLMRDISLTNTHIGEQIGNMQLLDSARLQKGLRQLVVVSRALQIRKRETMLRVCFSRGDEQKATEVRGDVEKLLTLLCRRGKPEDEFRAVQNIARDLMIHVELVQLWGILQDSLTLQCTDMLQRTLGKILQYTLSSLFYLCLDNESCRNEVLRLLRPNLFNLSVRALPQLIQQLTDFEHVSQYNAGLCYQSVLQKCTFEHHAALAGLEWIRASIRRRDHGRHSDLQSLAAMSIITHFQSRKVSLLSPSDSETMAELISLLGECADKNPAVAGQCRALVSPAILKECLKSATSGLLVDAWVLFLENVYSQLPQDDTAECLECLLPWLGKALQSGKALVSMGMEGLYEQVFPKNQPERVELTGRGTLAENTALELWWMLSAGDEWAVKTGICHSLPRILLSQVRLSPDISAALRRVCESLQQEVLKVHQLVFRVDKNFDQLNSSALKSATFACYKACSLYLRGELTEAFFEQSSSSDVTVLEESTPIAPAGVPSNQVLPIESLPVTNVNSLTDMPKGPWLGFLRVVKEVCTGETMSAKAVIKETIMHVPLIEKLVSATLNNKERMEIAKSLKIMTKKVKPEFQPIVFQILSVIMESSQSTTKIRVTVAEVMRDSGAITTALGIILKPHDVHTLSAAIEFLIMVLSGQSFDFQNWFISQLIETEVYLPLFQLLALELGASLDRIYSDPGDYLMPAERELVAPYFCLGYRVAELRDVNQKILLQLLELVRLCCDNCNNNSQMFMSAQNRTDDDPLAAERDSINVVTTIASYLVKLCQGGLSGSGESLVMLNACLDTLAEFVTGPCEENQTQLGCDVQLISSLNLLLQVSFNRREISAWVSIMMDTLTFLHTFLEAGRNQDVAESLIRYLDIPALLAALQDIYEHKIKFNAQDILLMAGNEEDETVQSDEKSNELIDVGFSIMMLLLKLQKFFPTNPDLFVLNLESEDESITSLNLSVLSHLPHEHIAFYSSLIGYVEITRNGTVEAEFFKIPYMCKFLTVDTKQNAIIKAMDLSHHQKIQNFLQLTLLYRTEMQHQQNLYRLMWVKGVSKGWKIYGWVSFLCIFIINITLLISASYGEVTYIDAQEREKPVNLFTICMGVIQLIFSFISFVCYLTEYLPNIAEKIDLTKEDSLEFPDYPTIWHNDSVLMKSILQQDGKAKSVHAVRAGKLWNVVSNFNTIYSICFLIVSGVAIVIPALYAVLLLDVFKRSDELVNIVRAVTQNKKQLVLTIIMGIIVVYMFSMVSIVGFQDYFGGDDNSMYCETLWDCFFSIIHQGTRSGGGMGDQLTAVSLSDNKYYPRILLDLLFFAIVILIVQNIIFGIIVDTFGELRDQRQMLMDELNTQCYVCGVSRNMLERSGKGWVHHFLNEHSLFAYMAFITYVKEKKESECTGLEKYVREKIKLGDASFFPNTSKFLQDRDIAVDDEQDAD